MRTPLYDRHVALGGRMVDFAGWELPVQYAGILEEHRAVREGAGLFDVSHMGELLFSGPDARAFLQGCLTNNLARLDTPRAVYSPLCYEHGGTVDDLIVYPRGDTLFVVVNASNTDKDEAFFRERLPGSGVTMENVSKSYAQLALQGPRAKEILSAIGGEAAVGLPFFGCGEFSLLGNPAFVSSTGYTGERGFEIYLAPEHAGALWDALVSAGAVPCGLGARDTLRLEAALPLYGHELSAEITPPEAGLSRFVKFDHEFLSRAALENNPPRRRLIGLVPEGRGIPRAEYPVLAGDAPCGAVTSGGVTPNGNLAMALVEAAAQPPFFIVIRGKAEPAREVELPFLKK